MFKLSLSTDTEGVSTMDEIEVSPALIVLRFGPPAKSDGYKVSGEYVFTNQEGEPFVVHDWKSTCLWEQEFPSPDEFWGSEEPQEFCIATRGLDTAVFKEWFLGQLG